MDLLLKLDRRWIFLLLLAAIILEEVAATFGATIPVNIVPSSLVKGVWQAIEDLPARAPVMISIDFDPASRAEVDPITRASLRQCFRKDLRVITMTHWPTGVEMARGIVDETVAEFDDMRVEALGVYPTRKEALVAAEAAPRTPTADAVPPSTIVNVGRRRTVDGPLAWRQGLHDALAAAKVDAAVVAAGAGPDGKGFEVLRVRSRRPTLEYGKDYCFLGTKAGDQVLVIAMGDSIATAFPTDSHNLVTRDMPVMQGVRSLKELSYLLTITSGSQADWWIVYGASKHHFPMGVACTAVIAPDLYPYVSTKQITGLCGGIKGAWEYETLVETPGKATLAVPAQTVAHCVLIFLILVCNVAYFLGGRTKS